MITTIIRQHWTIFLVAMSCLSQACNLPPDTPHSSRKSKLISIITEIAPPIVRNCVVREVGMLTSSDWERVATLSASENPTVTQTAHVVVEYVSGSCFDNADFDQEIANSHWSSPDAFISAIDSGQLLHSYGLTQLRALIDTYNLHQRCIFGLIKECKHVTGDNSRFAPSQASEDGTSFPDWKPEKKGFSELSLADFGKLFALTAKITTRSHFEGVDDGVDEYKTTLFRKANLAKLSEHDGLFIALPEQALGALAVGAQRGCTGASFGDELIVLDGEELRKPVRVKLPKGVDWIEPEEGAVADVLHFRIVGEYEHSSPAQKTCESSYWARQFEYRYSLDCYTAQRGGCKLTKRLIQENFGCSSNICD